MRWIQRAKICLFQRKIFTAVIAGLIYWIWLSRNRKLWQGESCSTVDIIQSVKREVKNRVKSIGCKKNEMKFFDSFINL